MQKKLTAILILGAVMVLSSIGLDAQPYKLQRWVFGSGGVVDAQTTNNTRMSGIVGQFAIDKITGSNYAVEQGFWIYFEYVDVPENPKSENNLYNYPNPFFTNTTIKYELAGTAVVTLKIYDMMGNVVKTLVQGSVQDVGEQFVEWDGRNESGMDVSSGSYIYELSAQPAQVAGAAGFSSFTMRNVMILVR
jgi:hypothetical protein